MLAKVRTFVKIGPSPHPFSYLRKPKTLSNMTRTNILIFFLSTSLLLTACNSLSNTAKGGIIGGTSGTAVGTLIGALAGNGKGAAIGAAVGAVVGTGAGILIGNKMDKAAAAAQAANATVEVITDEETGVEYVKATFDSALLFETGKYTLSDDAKASLTTFITTLVEEDNTFDIAIFGYTDNQGWKNCTAEQSVQKNLTLSQQRAEAVKAQMLLAGYPSSHLVSTLGYGEENPVASNDTPEGQSLNRRVEVHILASDDMIEAANAQAQ